MSLNATFFITSALFGLGLAVDGFLIALSNGLNNSKMAKPKIILTASVFAVLQLGAVILGWFCVVEIVKYFSVLEDVLSYIALFLLFFIGIKMIVNWAKNRPKKTKRHSNTQETDKNTHNTTQNSHGETIKVPSKTSNKNLFLTIVIQGLITSVDALSVGFVISSYTFFIALISAIIISFITFNMYLIGFKIGKTCGVKLGNRAELLGGIVFILIGIEIFVFALL